MEESTDLKLKVFTNWNRQTGQPRWHWLGSFWVGCVLEGIPLRDNTNQEPSVRAGGFLRGRLLRAGARNSAPLKSLSLVTFLAKQESNPPEAYQAKKLRKANSKEESVTEINFPGNFTPAGAGESPFAQKKSTAGALD